MKTKVMNNKMVYINNRRKNNHEEKLNKVGINR